ncbi:copper uptake system-associated protein [Tateyamaria sp. syn59]|uniref:copper uptake system-associated protein n=1 Tax=Tateyamaria sp. syn59 TaxID=2576942 RepID=UPI0011BD5844|nr:copper uptake system-associated protein [Tateyamaria sp. syn59]
MQRILFLILAMSCAAPAITHEYLVGTLAIIHPNTHPTGPNGDLAKGYMELFNGGSEPERLLAVRSGIADVSFFDPNADDGHGARVGDAIEIAPGQSVLLRPDTLQIRFAGLVDPLRVGDKFLTTLVFESVGEVTVEFWVEGIAETQPDPIPAAVPNTRPEQVAEAAITAQLLARLGADTDVVTVSVAGSAAVAGWMQGEDAGRAFLRQHEEDWQLMLLSGGSLVSPAGLRAQGLSPRLANELLETIQGDDAKLPIETRHQIDSFEGTLILTNE